MSVTDAQRLPRTLRGRATRDRILDCAAGLLVNDGVSALSMDNVRQAADVSGSQLSHYFVDKDALISAIVARQTEILLDFHRQPELRSLDTFDDFERWVELTMKLRTRRAGEPIPTFGGLAGQLSKRDESIRDRLSAGYQQWLAIFRSGLTRMKKNGLLVADADPAALAHVLISAHEGGALMSSAYAKAWPDQEALTYGLAYLRRFAARPVDRDALGAGKRSRAGRGARA